MFERTDVSPEDHLSSLWLDVRYIATFGRGERKKGSGESAGNY